MSAATAPITDVSRTDVSATDDNRPWNKAGQPKAQCTPMPLPALGTQRIIQGNGTNVGTVISLQCPERHRLVGREMMCVMGTNSTLWVGDTYCKPLSSYEENGFRVAVLASIVSSAIILLMSMAFITCCLVDCIKEDKRKRRRERQICGNGRRRPNIRRTTGLATAIKAGTTLTTTTPRRRCCHFGKLLTQPCVTAGKTADVISTTRMTLPLCLATPLFFLLSLAKSMTNLLHLNLHRLKAHHLNTWDLLSPSIKPQVQAMSTSRQLGLVWCGSLKVRTAIQILPKKVPYGLYRCEGHVIGLVNASVENSLTEPSRFRCIEEDHREHLLNITRFCTASRLQRPTHLTDLCAFCKL